MNITDLYDLIWFDLFILQVQKAIISTYRETYMRENSIFYNTNQKSAKSLADSHEAN